MQYEPIKRSLGRVVSGSLFLRKTLYFLLDILLLRSWHVRKKLRQVSGELPVDSRMLDAGSGFGQYTWRMSRMNKRWKIMAVDIMEDQIADCSVFFKKAGLDGRVEFETGDLTKLADINSYNLILSVDVMEHITEDVMVFRNFYRALQTGGILIISTPSDKGGSDVHGEGEESFIDEHVRDGYGVGEISEKLKKAGFSSVEAKYTYGKPGSISWLLSMKYPVMMINTSYLFFILLPFYYLLVFPVSLVLNIIDVHTSHSTGTGLLVTARK